MPLFLVNVIPASLSGETRQDSECSVAVNPVDPRQVAVTAFTVDPASSGNAPIFVSTDGGATWTLDVCVPGGNVTGDISVRFGGTTGELYAAILRRDNSNLSILRAPTFPPVGLMTELVNRAGPDQPWVETGWVGGAGGGTRDRVYVTMNTGTAEVQFSLDAATAAPPAGFGAPVDVEARAGGDRPSVRGGVHRSGVVYGLFIGVRPAGSDIVVVRDDNWGSGGWTSLVEPGDAAAGRRVAGPVTVPPVGTLLGSVRVSSRIAIAVDPRESRRVYVAWCDGAVTQASPFRLHLRRSDDGGANWTGDLFPPIDHVTNPGLAVSVRGTVGLLYQRLETPAAGSRWETHLVLSDDHFATIRADMVVANLRDLGGTFQPTIGDYANLIAVGKDFHGAFCGYNQPVAADFPGNITYLRNADWANQRLLDTDGITVIGNSIDPFYLHYNDTEPHEDFYVRDWTDSPASGDNGVEPSTHPAFWQTPDVWNRRGTSPGTFPNDQPDNEPAGNGAGVVGENWAFARIRRRAPGPAVGATIVTAHFLVSKLGTGSNYADASSIDPDVSFPDPDSTVTFNAADVGPITTTPFHWHLNPVGSSHLCVAVEISAPNDPYVGESLRGRAPGWPGQDLELLDDNNKAQRNMGLSVTPARGIESCEATLFGVVHNAATVRRDLVLEYEIPDRTRRRVKTVSIEATGIARFAAEPRGQIVLKGLEPGENRWLSVSFKPPNGRVGEIDVVDIFEMAGTAAVNGFSLGTRLGSQSDALGHAVERHRSVFTRLQHGWHVEGAEAEAEAALAALRTLPSRTRWIKELRDRWDGIGAMLVEGAGDDPLDVTAAVENARTAMDKRAADALVCLGALLERVDMALTLKQLAFGDRADIRQTATWQAELLEHAFGHDPAGQQLAQDARTFVTAYGARLVDEEQYVAMLRDGLERFRNLTQVGAPAEFRRRLADLEEAVERRDVVATQGAHRRVLTHLQAAAEA
ncbi:hypothetical protein AB0E63_26295 [Kribbella sp. NPDC026596]|uniref:hypothetical protein n=1 Tax=Kribbella sp. NPDC026596 TaxID=3155122 RepID=UPI0033C39E44